MSDETQDQDQETTEHNEEWTDLAHKEQVQVRLAEPGEVVSTLSGPQHSNAGDYVLRRRMGEDDPWDYRLADRTSLAFHFNPEDLPTPAEEEDEEGVADAFPISQVNPDEHKLADLQDMAREAGLSTVGSKAEIAERLNDAND